MVQRILLSTVFSFIFSTLSFAQLSVGVSGGANLSFWQWALQTPFARIDLDYHPGISGRAAAHAEYAFSPVLALRADVAYQAISYRITDLTDENGVILPDNRIIGTYNTWGGSLLARVSPLSKNRNLYCLAGPTMAYVTNGQHRFKGEGLEPGAPRKMTIDLDENKVRRMQWSADLGLGYSFACGAKGRLAAEARYQLGLSKFSTASTVDAHMQSALLTLGYFHSL